MIKKKVSVSVNPELWKSFRIKCIREDKEYSDKIEDMIRKEVGSDGSA